MRNLHKFGYIMLTVTILSAPTWADSNKMKLSNTSSASTSFQNYDENSNGKISLTELQNNFLGNVSSGVFQSYDTSNDGSLDRAEFNKFMEKNSQISMSNKNELMQTKKQNMMMQQEAAQKNAALQKQYQDTIEDVEKYNSRPKVKMTLDFIVMDLNNDDQIDIGEFEARTNSVINADRVFGSYDANKDNKLNISEFKRYVNSEPKIPVTVSAK